MTIDVGHILYRALPLLNPSHTAVKVAAGRGNGSPHEQLSRYRVSDLNLRIVVLSNAL